MPSTPRCSCSYYSVSFPIAAMSREIFGGGMTVMSSMNETALVPGTGELVQNSLNIFIELALL